jgi:hypothetical protein
MPSIARLNTRRFDYRERQIRQYCEPDRLYYLDSVNRTRFKFNGQAGLLAKRVIARETPCRFSVATPGIQTRLEQRPGAGKHKVARQVHLFRKNILNDHGISNIPFRIAASHIAVRYQLPLIRKLSLKSTLSAAVSIKVLITCRPHYQAQFIPPLSINKSC